MIPGRWLALLLLLFSIALPARAHDALPIALELKQAGAQDYSLRARFPPAFRPGSEPRLDVDPPCEVTQSGTNLARLRCPDSNPPAAIRLEFPGPAGNAPVILRLSYRDGQRGTVVAPPGTQRLILPDEETAVGVFADHFATGLGHIIGGFDHLLFLFCLIVIAGSARRVVWAVSGFTAGHAVTICLAAVGLVAVNAAAIEVLIALSIVFAAAEAARARGDDIMARHPALIAMLFGLLHGLGFAGALAETGLPQSKVAAALVAFNLGIETGQLLFVLAIGLALLLLARMRDDWPLSRHWRAAVMWPVGVIASYFTFARLLG